MAKTVTLAKCDELQPSFHAAADQVTIGIDLGDKYSECCLLGADGAKFAEGRVRSTPEALASHFRNLPPSRFAIEVGGHSSLG